MAITGKGSFWIGVFGLGLWMLGSAGCGADSPSQTLHKTRLSISAEPKQPRLDDQQMEELFNKAVSVGIQSGYRVVYANPEQGIVSLAKELSPEHVPITLNVEIQKEAERTAYAEMILQCPRMIDDSHLLAFKEAFSARLKRKKEELPAAAETVSPPAAPPDKPPAKTEPAKAEAKAAPEKAPASFVTVSKNARVRVDPNTNGKILVIFPSPTKVQKLGQTGDWVRVKLPSGEVGWVYKTLVKEEKTSG